VIAATVVVLGLGGLRLAHAEELLLRVGDLQVPPGTVAHGDAIAVGGTLAVGGTVEGDAVAIGGSVEVRGRVAGSVHAVGGDVILNPTAVVGGTATTTGGRVRIAPGATVGGVHAAPAPGQPVPPPPAPFPGPPGPSVPIPLPGSPPVPLPWWGVPGVFGVIAAFHFLYWAAILIALVGFVGMNWFTAVCFPGTVTGVAADLQRMPAAALVAGVIGWLLVWPLIVILALTVVGLVFVVVIPVLILIAIQFGVTAVALLAGRRLRQSGIGREVLVGSVVLAIAFAIPHLGWLLMFGAATWGGGAVLLALVERVRARRFPPTPPPAAA